MSSRKNLTSIELLNSTQKLGKSSEETTRTVQKIKAINASLVEITQKQYDIVNRVSSDGEHIKTKLSESVNTADNSLTSLNKTVRNMESEFNRIEESIHLFDNIRESTQSLNSVARYTKMLALNTSVLGGSLGSDGSGINLVAKEMQDLVQICEDASKHIDEVVCSARDNVQSIIKINRKQMQTSLENTSAVEQALKMLISLVKGSEKNDLEQHETTVDGIITDVGEIEFLAQKVSRIAEDTQSETDVLYNEVEVSNQAVSDLIGVVTDTPITNLSPNQAIDQAVCLRIIDVRRPDEFNDHLGHIENAKLCTINETSFKSKLSSLNKSLNYLFVCRSGGRSSRASRIAQSLGFSHIYNLDGGMLAWNECELPVVRD